MIRHEISRNLFKPQTIIWSADVPREEIEKVIRAKALPEGTVIKLDRAFFEENSKVFIRFCEESGYPVFCDAKIIEIPSKVMKIAESYLRYKPFMLNIMAGACSTGNYNTTDKNDLDALARFAEACIDAGTKSCVVTVLTSKSEQLVFSEFGSSPIDQVMKYTHMAMKSGITDIVCSPKEIKVIRGLIEFNDIWLNTPGVRLPGSSKDDQKRVTTPREALISGANRLVIGRDLTGNPNDGDIVERIKRNYDKIMENIFE
jgi:orotidine-5'-phosphate decarboxylase